jgi:trehalose 6-phosphate phosphatase
MTYALSRDGLASLRTVSGDDALLAFDIDGTLAPIVTQPWTARIPDDIQRLLTRLHKLRAVAIVTGRSVPDARRMLAFEPSYLVGNHGAEGVPGHDADAEILGPVTQGWVAAMTYSNASWPPAPGVLLENKGCSLAIHYRNAANHSIVRALIEQIAAGLAPVPRLIHGKCVVNLVPPGAPHKGDALRALLVDSGHARAIYVGDDVTDDDVFRLRLPGVISVRVAPIGERVTDLYLNDQAEVAMLLRELADMIERSPARCQPTRG